jgi:creatinine amidohydrolase/Fe(II)-dependent formamide hydrolase-like protein
MFSAILTAALVLGSPEPRRKADAWLVTPAFVSAASLHRSINKRQPGAILSVGVIEEHVVLAERMDRVGVQMYVRATRLRLLVSRWCDTDVEWYYAECDLMDVPLVRGVVWE